MRTIIGGVLASLALAPALAAPEWSVPPDAQAGAANIFLQCSVTAQGLSDNCHFYTPIDDPSERLMAGTELGFLDAHPFLILGAAPGANVKVLVRLKVSTSASGKSFDVAAMEAASPAPTGPEIKDPVWTVSPHASWAGGFVPVRAFQANQRGEATVGCEATDTGSLVNCWVEKESPADFGFGEAALLLLQHARMRSVSASGAPVAGRAYVQTFRYGGYGAQTPLWTAMTPGASMSSMPMSMGPPR